MADSTLGDVLQRLRLEGRFSKETKTDLLDKRIDQLSAFVEDAVPLSTMVMVLAEVGINVHKSTLSRYLRDQFPTAYAKNYPHRFCGSRPRQATVEGKKPDSPRSDHASPPSKGSGKSTKPRSNPQKKTTKTRPRETTSMVDDYLAHNLSEG